MLFWGILSDACALALIHSGDGLALNPSERRASLRDLSGETVKQEGVAKEVSTNSGSDCAFRSALRFESFTSKSLKSVTRHILRSKSMA